MPTRRQAFGVFAAIPLLPHRLKAQGARGKIRIGVLMPSGENDPETGRRINAVKNKLEDLGWKVGKNLEFFIKYLGGDPSKATGLARDIVDAKVDIILTAGTEGSKAAHAATNNLPIVMATIGDPVGIGLAQNLSRPGGNITGFSLNASDLSAKRVEFARACLPNARRIAVAGNMENESVSLKSKSIEDTSVDYQFSVKRFNFSTASAMESVFISIHDWGADVVLTTEDAVVVANRDLLLSLARRNGIPVMSEFAVLADAGAILSYGPSTIDLWKRSAIYIDKILRGTPPSVLPIEQPTSFELVLNRKSADIFSLKFPVILEGMADRIIE